MRWSFPIDDQIIKEKQMTAKEIENSISFQNVIWDSASLARNPRASMWCTAYVNRQKKPPEVFYKNRCSENFRKIHRKTLLPESLFKKETLIKKETLAQVFFCEFWEILKNTFFTERLRTTASQSICDLPLK